jgi:NAD(P)-dependent dehydrogenase (short-subunit alcohol dehydrogenase family)
MALPKRDRSIHVTSTPVDQLNLAGRHLVAIGGTNGLGQAIAEHALDRGAHVTVVGRTLRGASHDRLDFMAADLSSMREAARVGRELPVEGADVMLFTTGIIAAKTREQTPEGLERDMAISFLSRMAILDGAAQRLGITRADRHTRPRVFVMGSPGWGELGTLDDLNSEGQYSSSKAHGNSIAGNEALVLAGSRRYPGSAFFGLAPGAVKTDIRSNLLGEGSATHRIVEGLIGVLAQSATTYGRRMLPVLFSADLDGLDGVNFNRKGRPVHPSRGFDESYAGQFLAASDGLLRRALANGTT